MSSLRFCFLTTFYPPYNFGGDGIAVQRLARGLVRDGHRVTVIHDADAYATLSRAPVAAPEPEPAGLEVVALRSRLGSLSVLLTQQLGRPVVNRRRISGLVANGGFDVINFHNISLLGGPGLLSYGKAPKLYLAHEHWLVCPTHVLWRYRREPCPSRECLRCQISYRRPPQAWRWSGLLERQLGEVDLFIALSEFSRAKHREFGFPREMEVLPCFLPELAREGLTVSRARRPQQRPYFLFVGRLERIKGLQDVIPVFAGYRDADLLVAGDGEYAAELRAQAAGMEQVRFLGRLTTQQLSGYYQHAVAVIVPSLGFETFGMTLIEAFRESTPVIARRLGSFPEIVDASGGGELFSTREELLAAMRRLQDDPAHRDRLARAGAAAFEKRWSERVVLPRYLELVDRAIEHKRGRMAPVPRAAGV